MFRLGVLASHQGTNFQNIADACADGSLNARVTVLICNNSNAPVMKRAENLAVPAFHLSSASHPDSLQLDSAIHARLVDARVDLVVLAGYMKKLGLKVLSTYEGKIINVHPSLLPKHGGKGCFGMHVHAAVIDAGDAETGATVHLVTANYDEGGILKQEAIPVLDEDTPESLAVKVHKIEYRLLLATIREMSEQHDKKENA